MIFFSKNAKETIKIGERIGVFLKKGDIVGIIGELGSGKTTLIKGIVKNFSKNYVFSPSFVIVNEYKGKIPIFHFDIYRIKNFDELIDIGWNDYINKGIILIEWAEKIKKNLPRNSIYVKIKVVDENKRIIEIKNLKRSKNDK
ncbi:MAG: tRNA (adenosine(37)-N6)-threonylcarbamoyltransferase complex ATPase subunit type 1 TsaE [Candidatus Omnitrophica bacterium]|nr:tRNA (adenosine(37)-N6)-threonylcarbamoyltransferase complex ATPase subunit type 1 TsaE [Candidatus Omnitrophota bacterium]MCM8811345.1 tRNA (adenosine(37)-N6)-threonylcarbamoyltransferase complex ATPase subunit type 1 TsaE [Candidatus Omnitrophota bacterium]MCM8832991.1 tRNA (adenosine(37)-N6)-threonylcarbamoyltransferase complex ATPase subunit type 1 TsaE [Candidatus Omnitrophota bacterium]